MTCALPAKEEYYDLKELKRQNHRLDRLVDFVAIQNGYRLQNFQMPSRILRGFNNVTRELVRQFRAEAISFVQQVRGNRAEYGYLYNIIDDKDPISHAVYINYETFPLMEDGVLSEIQFTANKLLSNGNAEYEVTCLYLLLFYALLVNRHVNWVTMEYVTNTNVEHSYAIHINWLKNLNKISTRNLACKIR